MNICCRVSTTRTERFRPTPPALPGTTVLRAQAGAEAAADEGRQHAHLVLGETEDAADVVVAVLRACVLS